MMQPLKQKVSAIQLIYHQLYYLAIQEAGKEDTAVQRAEQCTWDMMT